METAFNFLIFMKLTVVRFLTGFQIPFGIRFSQNDLLMEILIWLQMELESGMLPLHLIGMIFLVEIYKELSTI